MTEPEIAPLLPDRDMASLRRALAAFTVDGVAECLGPAAYAALARGDLAGARRALRGLADPVATLISLFLLGAAVDEQAAEHALAPLPLAAAQRAGLIELSGGSVRARVEIRPYGEAGSDLDWWLVSDFGTDVRPGRLEPDHVLGVGEAALTLARATSRRPAGRALDVGTGCGVLALHLARHCRAVVATDVSTRALRFAATGAALSGQHWDLRRGSLLAPVAEERFDLVVANPPFVLSPGWDRHSGGFDYRDAGLAGDELCARLVSGLPGVLTDGGTAQLLANWAVGSGGDWPEQVERWLAGTGADAWIWQRELLDPAEYVTMWLTDAGEVAGSTGWAERYDDWLDWFAAAGIAAVGMGLVHIRRTASATPTVVCEDVGQPLDPPLGTRVDGWFTRLDRLRAWTDTDLLAQRLVTPGDVELVTWSATGGAGWRPQRQALRQTTGMCFEVEVDEAVAAFIAGCDGSNPVANLVDVLALALGQPVAAVAAALLPVVRDLTLRGLIEPVEGSR